MHAMPHDTLQTFKILLDGVTAGFVQAVDRDSAARKTRKVNPHWFADGRSVVFLLVKP